MRFRGGHRVYFFVDGYGPCGWYRCAVPANALVERGYEASIGHELTSEIIEWADVIVVQREATARVLKGIEYAQQRGKLVVFEIDDSFWNIPPSNPCHYRYTHPVVIQGVEQAARVCDVVTTTTPELAIRLRTLNANVQVLPNMLPSANWPHESPKPQTDDRVIIGWAGSNTHFADLALLKGVLEKTLEEFPNAEFHWAGMQKVPFDPHPRIRALPTVPIEKYAELISQFDIGLAPLEDNAFNRCKSDLKYLEYAILGLPVIASRVAPYQSNIDNGVNGFTARNGKDWGRYLKMLVGDRDLRAQLGEEAQKHARTRLIEPNIDRWVQAYGLAAPQEQEAVAGR